MNILQFNLFHLPYFTNQTNHKLFSIPPQIFNHLEHYEIYEDNYRQQITTCIVMLHITRAAYSNSFQVSGNPGRHQWLQSTPAWSPLYADGWASFLNWDRVVISSKNTGFLILLNTFLTTSTSGGFPAGYIDPDNGCCSPLQSFEADFHSLPLSLTTYHDFRRNFKIRVEGRYKVYIYIKTVYGVTYW